MVDRFLDALAKHEAATAALERRTITALTEIAVVLDQCEVDGWASAISILIAELDIDASAHEKNALDCYEDTPLPGDPPKRTAKMRGMGT